MRDAAGALQTYTCSFLFACAGYYDYSAGYTPDLPGIAEYRGRVVHPQKWTEDIDFAGKRVVVIGSGATAMTLVPALAKQAAHVTMLQRSPTYVISMPSEDRVAEGLKRLLPPRAAHAATRWKNVLLATAFYNVSRRYPERVRRFLLGNVKKAIGTSVDLLLENGEVWNNDSIRIYLDQAILKKPIRKRVNTIEIIEVKVFKERAWIAYRNQANFSMDHNTVRKAQWLESATAILTEKGWRLEMLHSTVIKNE